MLRKTWALTKDRALIYNIVVHTVLLDGSETWVVMEAMMMVLEGFHHNIAKRILRIIVWRGNGGEWVWDLVDVVLEFTGL